MILEWEHVVDSRDCIFCYFCFLFSILFFRCLLFWPLYNESLHSILFHQNSLTAQWEDPLSINLFLILILSFHVSVFSKCQWSIKNCIFSVFFHCLLQTSYTCKSSAVLPWWTAVCFCRKGMYLWAVLIISK